ncbi:MAG: hypothetical protein AAF823_00250 [Planctomycetota bacterium]
MTQVDTLPVNEPDAVELDDTNLYRVLKAIGVTFVVLAPVALLAMPGIGVVARIWIAFLAANLLVWTGVVAAAAVHAITRAFAAAQRPQAEPTEATPAAQLAPAA